MPNKSLKGLTVTIGGDTSELNKALKGVEAQSQSLSSELGQVNKLLKLDPKNTELLAQKQQVLAEAIGQTEKKLEMLKDAELQVQEQFERGEVSEAQYRALQREIIATEKKLDGYKKAAQETADAVDDLGKDAKTTGDKIDDMGDDAKDAEADVEGLGDTLETGLAVGLGAVAAAAVGAAAGIKSVVDETAEYRNAMGKLDTAFQSNGHSSQAATDTYKELQSVIGETDQAVEAAAFIAKLADSEEELAKWTNIATGVYGQFGASLPIEGLTEAANETAKVGQVTGPLADALNWAAQEGETFGVKMKEATDANEEWNKAVEEAKSAEDFFNLALQECSTEAERQTLIMEALNSMYSETADQYRETNAEVIAQNKATEKLNAAWAQVGEKAAPIVTTFTEGMAELVEAFFDLIEDVDIDPFLKKLRTGFQTVAKDVLPKLVKALEWCIDNFDLLKSVALGFITALAAKKVMTFATAISGTLTAALKKGTKGMEAMNATAKANPYIMLATAIIGVATAIGSYFLSQAEKKKKALRDATLAAYGLTEAEKEMAERVRETADAYREQRTARDESIAGTVSQFDYLSALKNELFELADAQGAVQQKDQARAQFIAGELSEKLGLEIQLVDGVIQEYQKLKTAVDEAMVAKKTELLLADSEQAYVDAVKTKSQVEADYYTAVTAYHNAWAQQRRVAAELEAAYSEKESEEFKKKDGYYRHQHQLRIWSLEDEKKALDDNLSDAKAAYDSSRSTIEAYYIDIGQYETAHKLSLEGNTAEAARVLADRAYYMQTYAQEVGFASTEITNSLGLNAVDAGVKAKLFKENWENGVDGYTKEMVEEAEQGYQEAIDAFANAYADAEAVGDNVGTGLQTGLYESKIGVQNEATGLGEDVDNGLIVGMQNRKGAVFAEGVALIEGLLAKMDKTVGRNSPAKRTIEFAEDVGEGVVVGLDNKTKDVNAAAGRQISSMLDTYRAHEAEAQRSMQTIAARQVSNQIAYQTSAATANTPMLGKILAAIEKGQVLLLDGDTVAGKTAGKTDAVLGARKILTDRSAL